MTSSSSIGSFSGSRGCPLHWEPLVPHGMGGSPTCNSTVEWAGRGGLCLPLFPPSSGPTSRVVHLPQQDEGRRGAPEGLCPCWSSPGQRERQPEDFHVVPGKQGVYNVGGKSLLSNANHVWSTQNIIDAGRGTYGTPKHQEFALRDPKHSQFPSFPAI